VNEAFRAALPAYDGRQRRAPRAACRGRWLGFGAGGATRPRTAEGWLRPARSRGLGTNLATAGLVVYAVRIETGEVVPREDMARGYEVAKG
jgi:hypothetical protein